MTKEEIRQIAECRVKEWIDYADNNYGWNDAQYELFEEPMIEVASQVAFLIYKDFELKIEQLENTTDCLFKENAELKKKSIVLHDLKKDPTDLPSIENLGYVITNKGVTIYNKQTNSWYPLKESKWTNEIVAWCEIPKLGE